MWNSSNLFVTVNPFLILIVICCDFNSTRKYQKANLSQWLEMGWRRKISVDKRASTWNDYINIFLLNLHLTIWEHIVQWKSFAHVLRHTSTRRCLIGPRSFCSITNIPKNHQKRQKGTSSPASDAGLCKALISRSWSQSEISREHSEFYWYRLEGKGCTCWILGQSFCSTNSFVFNPL